MKRILVAAMLATLAATTACQGSSDSGAPRGASPTASGTGPGTATATPVDAGAGATPATPDYVRRTVPTGEAPAEVVRAAGSLWVVSHRGAAVTRIDPASGSVLATVPSPGGELIGAAAAAGHVWFLDADQQQLEGIDPASNTVTVTVPVNSDGGGLAPDGRLVWFAGTSGVLLAVDGSGRVVHRVRVAGRGAPPISPWVAGGHVYVANPETQELLRVDPRAGRVVHRLHLDADIGTLGSGFGSLWVGGWSGTLYRVDPATDRLQATIAVDAVDHLAFGRTKVWVRVSDTQLVSVDPRTDQVGPGFELPAAEIPGGGVLAEPKDLWVVNWSDDDVWEIPTTS